MTPHGPSLCRRRFTSVVQRPATQSPSNMHGVFDEDFHPGAASVAPMGEVRGEDHRVGTINLLYAGDAGTARRPAVRTPPDVIADPYRAPPRMPKDHPANWSSASEAIAQGWVISGYFPRKRHTYRDREKKRDKQSHRQKSTNRQGGLNSFLSEQPNHLLPLCEDCLPPSPTHSMRQPETVHVRKSRKADKWFERGSTARKYRGSPNGLSRPC